MRAAPKRRLPSAWPSTGPVTSAITRHWHSLMKTDTSRTKDGVLAVGTGQGDIGWVDQSTASVSMLAGVPVKAVATVQEKNATGLTVLQGTDLDSPDDVRGLRIGSTPGGSDSTLVPAFL